jgi:hypothetical protein
MRINLDDFMNNYLMLRIEFLDYTPLVPLKRGIYLNFNLSRVPKVPS